jgi:choline dehydrogenase-like flavoprotein
MATTEHFDCIVAGSGFGGAVTACRLAEAGRRVLVLERGRVYPPGSFPRGLRENLWDPKGGRHGMFDGSVMPGPLGPNPSLTIAALADRFADAMLGENGPAVSGGAGLLS